MADIKMTKKRVLIVGAGASGLPAIKCCLNEGLEPICLERSGDIGGLWNYANSIASKDESAYVMKSTIANSSKEMMCYSDFLIPDEFPNYMHNTFVLRYLNMYADAFKIRQHIQLNTEVVRLRPVKDCALSGRWEAQILNKNTNEEKTEVFDAVMICTGLNAKKCMPCFEGEDNFKGAKVHTRDLHDVCGYEDKRAVVVGIGNSGGDVAIELSRICSEVYLSTRRGCWIMNRVWDKGLPLDMCNNRRVMDDIRKVLPESLINSHIEGKLNSKFDHALYGLKPEHRFFGHHVTINDDLPNAIISGRVIVKPNISRLTESSVEFDDGSVVESIDTVIYATGYEFGFPFVEHKALKIIKNDVNLYKMVFPPDIQPSTLAVIGCFQGLGANFPASEMQCRWAVKVFKGETQLPSPEDMWKDIQVKKVAMSRRYFDSRRNTTQVDFISYMDELAELIGCRPNFRELLKVDPWLALNMYFGPVIPSQYRVMGPGAWNGARDAIFTTWKRFEKPLQTRKVPVSSFYEDHWILIVALAVLLLVLLVKSC